MSTIQLDFNLPERFDLEYTGSDGERHRPFMIHRALFGSIERFFGVLTEHYAGAFPPWLAPVQVVAIPISSEQNDYLEQFANELRATGVRVQLDAGDERMQKKIRDHTLQKVPLIVLAGPRDQSGGTVSFRFRDGTQENDIPLQLAAQRIRDAIAQRVQL
jgi:threonyl-tRNA synthetase